MSSEKIQAEYESRNDLNSLIRTEQIRIIYNNMPSVLASNSLIPLLLLYALWDKTEHRILLFWVGLMLGFVLLRGVLLAAYRQSKPKVQSINRWRSGLFITSLISGALWGAAGLLFAVPAEYEQFSLVVLVLHALGAASVISYAPYLPVFFAFFLPTLMPLAIALLIDAEHSRTIIAFTTLLYVIVVGGFAANLHKVFRESLRLRFENLDLVDELTAQKIELTAQKELAEQANIAKTRFLAAASHDLRQPLHAMGLFVSALSERVRGAGTRKLVSQLGASTEALRGLLNSLLDISRLDAGVIQPHVTQCSIQELFGRLAHDYSVIAEEKNIALKFMSTKYWALCDAALLERIVRNLVSNAVRYTECGGVLVGCRRRGELLRIEVWDTGIGMVEYELDKIFQEFYQVGNTERDRSKGLGLGLAIAQRLAQLLEQKIEVKSAPGKGTVFALTVSRCDDSVSINKSTAVAAPGQLPSALVVVIDDELAIREATQIMLQGWGCETVLADSAEFALKVLAQMGRSPDVIVVDYRLPEGKTGVQAIEVLHEQYGRDIPAIIITGDTAPNRLREAENSGYHLMHKPLAPARLRALLSHVLSIRQ